MARDRGDEARAGAAVSVEHSSAALRKLREMKQRLEQELLEAEREKEEMDANDREERIIPLSLEDEFRPRGKRGQKPAGGGGGGPQQPAQQPPGAGGERQKVAPKRRDRETEQLMEDQRHEIATLQLKGQRLRCVIELRQQSSKRREERSDREIQDLKQRLDSTMVASCDQRELMQRLREDNGEIQSRVGLLQSTIESQAEVEKMNLVREYSVKMHELKKELAEQKQANYTGAQEWIDKNEMLEAELRTARNTFDLVKASNGKLGAENADLKVRYRQQEEERQSLVLQITQVRSENKRLAEQVGRLETEAQQVSGHVSKRAATAPNPGRRERVSTLPPPDGERSQAAADHEVRYLELINRVKRQLERERRTLKQVRSAHIDLLQERTELEIFLRLCIEDVRKEIARNTIAGPALGRVDSGQGPPPEGNLEGKVGDYNVQDRRRLLDLLMSKERVLNLLHQKTFPFKLPRATLAEELEHEADAMDVARIQSTSAELDMDSLWAKWKAWTEQAV